MKINLATFAMKIMAPAARAFEQATKDPIRAQRRILFDFLARNKNTEYGLKYNFAGIKSIEDYQRLVPLTDCEGMRPYIERMTKGEPNILTAEKPILFSLTSGSSGHPKFVPITKYSRAKKAEVINLWAYYILQDHPKISSGKILAIVSPEVDGLTPSGIPYGAESGHGYKNLPDSLKVLYALPYEVFEIRDYDARYYTILRIAMEQNITTIATMTPSTIILLCQRIEKVKGDVINDIEKGTLKERLDIQPEIRKVIAKALKPNPKRARELTAILEDRKALLPKYFWPDMELIECWKRGTVGLYLKGFPKYFGDVAVRDFGYFSSEARCSIPTSDEGAGGALAVNANFYEFIPKEDIGKKEKRILLCDRLEKGREYFIVLSTPGGLYRYNIDDLIRVDSFFNKTPVIEFVQKGTNVTSITGEKLYESEVVEAVERAQGRHKLLIEFVTASIELRKMPRYIFLVEFSENPTTQKKKEFLKSLEEELCRISEEYDFNRKAQELEGPVLKVVARGEFERFRAKRVKEGAHDGQFKVPQLTGDMAFQRNFKIEEEIFIDKTKK
ncbi:MAG: GH3 auxin-responsive promoter family protein [Candidatus Omnitrophota bacterium]